MTTQINFGTYGGSDFNLDLATKVAAQSKQAFISFVKELELHTVKPWIVDWLNERFTDEMAQIFFDRFWNGALDVVTLYTPFEELPSIIDDIDVCVTAMAV